MASSQVLVLCPEILKLEYHFVRVSEKSNRAVKLSWQVPGSWLKERKPEFLRWDGREQTGWAVVTTAKYAGENVLSGALWILSEGGKLNAVLLSEHSERDLPPAAPREGLLAWKGVPA